MKTIISICTLLMILQACRKAPENKTKDTNQSFVKIEGVINDGYLKSYPYSITDKDNIYPLDIIVFPDNRLGEKVVIKARIMFVDGKKVLTDVILDGECLQTNKQWAESKSSEPDPFAEDGIFPE
jgi:hypothetical protein